MMMTLRGSDMERCSPRWSVYRQPIVGEEDSRASVVGSAAAPVRRPGQAPRSARRDGGGRQLVGGAAGQYVGLAPSARGWAHRDHRGLAVVERREQVADPELGAGHRWLAPDRAERRTGRALDGTGAGRHLG